MFTQHDPDLQRRTPTQRRRGGVGASITDLISRRQHPFPGVCRHAVGVVVGIGNRHHRHTGSLGDIGHGGMFAPGFAGKRLWLGCWLVLGSGHEQVFRGGQLRLCIDKTGGFNDTQEDLELWPGMASA